VQALRLKQKYEYAALQSEIQFVLLDDTRDARRGNFQLFFEEKGVLFT